LLAVEEQLSLIDAGSAALDRVAKNLRRMRDSVLTSALALARSAATGEERLGDLLREPLRNGHSAKASANGTIPILTLSAVTLGDFSARNVKVTAADPERVAKLWVQPGDLLIERSNTRELVGTTRLYSGPSNFAVFPDLIIRARMGPRVEPQYAEIVLRAPSSRRYFQRRAQGISGTMPKIDQSAIAELVLPVPSLQVQAEVIRSVQRDLSLIDAMEIAVETANRRSSALRSAVLGAAFSGALVSQDPSDEPVSDLLEGIAGKGSRSSDRRAHAGGARALRNTA